MKRSGAARTRIGMGRMMLATALILGPMGCKKSALPQKTSVVCDRDGYIEQSGDYRADEGGKIRPAKSEQPVVAGYFGKPYNQDWLASIGQASILETIAFIETTGARVYRAEKISPRSSAPMASLLPLPPDLDQEWHQADRPMPDAPCGFLAGLYLRRGTSHLPSLRNEAALILREDAGRWTLVHEFMHHNFKVQAAKAEGDDALPWGRANQISHAIARLKGDAAIAPREYALRLAALFDELIDLSDRLLVEYHFEEVAVETLLQDRFERGELTSVSFGSYLNASWYIGRSKKLAEDLYAGMTAAYDEIDRIVSTNGTEAETRKIARYIELRDRRLAELDAIIAKRKRSSSMRQGFAARVDFVPERGAAPCADALAVENSLLTLANSLRLPRVAD